VLFVVRIDRKISYALCILLPFLDRYFVISSSLKDIAIFVILFVSDITDALLHYIFADQRDFSPSQCKYSVNVRHVVT